MFKVQYYFSIILITVLTMLCQNARSQSVAIVDNDKVVLTEHLFLYDSILMPFGDLHDQLPIKGPYDLQISVKCNMKQGVSGQVLFGSNYFKAYNWELIIGKDTVFHNTLSSHLPIQLGYDQLLIINFRIEELDKTNAEGLSVMFVPSQKFESMNENMKLFQAFFLGIFLFLCVFNFILYLITRWKVYYKYSLYIFSASVYFFYYFGFLQQAFPIIDNVSINVISMLYVIIFILYFNFINGLGNYKKSVPKADLYLKVGIVYKFVQMAFEITFHTLGFNFIYSTIYKYTFLGFEMILMGLIVSQIIKNKDFRGKIVILGSSVMILVAIITELNTGFGSAILDTGFDRAYILEGGILGELLIFSVALGYITKKHFEEKNENQKLYVEQLEKNEYFQRELVKSERKQNLVLEKRVSERTFEIHHRVKNNLQMISSLLNMQRRRLKTDEAQHALMTIRNRVKSIGLIHEYLYNNKNITEIDLSVYVNNLMGMLIETSVLDKKVETRVNVSSIQVDIDTAISIGLVLNELITNSIKHAFQDMETPLLSVKVEKIKDQLFLFVSDNGLGPKTESTGFGSTIIKTLIENANGSMSTRVDASGYHVEINIQEYQPSLAIQ